MDREDGVLCHAARATFLFGSDADRVPRALLPAVRGAPARGHERDPREAARRGGLARGPPDSSSIPRLCPDVSESGTLVPPPSASSTGPRRPARPSGRSSRWDRPVPARRHTPTSRRLRATRSCSLPSGSWRKGFFPLRHSRRPRTLTTTASTGIEFATGKSGSCAARGSAREKSLAFVKRSRRFVRRTHSEAGCRIGRCSPRSPRDRHAASGRAGSKCVIRRRSGPRETRSRPRSSTRISSSSSSSGNGNGCGFEPPASECRSWAMFPSTSLPAARTSGRAPISSRSTRTVARWRSREFRPTSSVRQGSSGDIRSTAGIEWRRMTSPGGSSGCE